MRSPLLAALAASLTLAAPIAAADPIPDPEPAGQYVFDRSLILQTPTLTNASPLIAAGGIREGGLSALQVIPGTGNRRFLSISDRGPNGQPTAATGGRTFPSPGFSPIVYELEASDDGRLSVISRTQLRLPGTDPRRTGDQTTFPGESSLITGIRNVTTAGLDDRTWLDPTDTTVKEYFPTDPYGLDTEGITRDPRDGSYWISEEYRPSIAHFDRNGVMISRLAPTGAGSLPTQTAGDASTAAVAPDGTLNDFYNGAGQPKLLDVLPQEYTARKTNRGLEGLAMSPDGTKLYAMMQNPLDTKGLAAQGYGTACGNSGDAPAQTSQNFYSDDRIVEIDVSKPGAPTVTGEWLYRLQQVSTTNATLQGAQRVSDISWAGPRKLIVDEHDDVNRNNRGLYEVDLTAGTNINTAYPTFASRTAPATIPAGRTQPLGCFLDNGSPAELAALPTPVTPATKSSYLNISTGPNLFNYDKVEGVALLDGQNAVAIVNDNDFGFAQDAATNVISSSPDPTSLLRIYAATPSSTAPSVGGTAKAGRTLTCTPGNYGGTGTLAFTYTWLRGGTPIAGADGARYTLSAEDVGATVACRVDATRNAGPVHAKAATQTSTATPAVADFDTGAQGPTGNAGAQGPTGNTGAQGNTGSQGPTGNTGAQGQTGNTGAQGPIGPAGTNGSPGATGPAGTNGTNGVAGPTGSKGDAGGKGDSGAAGPAGPKGDKGDVGPRGKSGKSPKGKITCELKRNRAGDIKGVKCKLSAARASRLLGRVAARFWG